MSILGELKRRKVFQVATVYAVVAWLLVQIVTAIEAPLALPAWVDTFVIVLLGIGFPIAVILSWAFDVTPEGIKSTPKSDDGAAVAQPSSNTFTYIVQILVLVAVGFLLLDQYVLSSGTDVDRTSSRPSDSAAGTTRYSIDFPSIEGQRAAAFYRMIAISNDGSQLLYSDNRHLYSRSFDSLESRVLMENVRAGLLMSSPDGKSVGYRDATTRQVNRLSMSGGAPAVISEQVVLERAYGLSWADEEIILYSTTEGVFRFAPGEDPQLVISVDDGRIPLWPELLPDGEHVVFSLAELGEWDRGELVVESLVTGERKVLLAGGSNPRYVPTGHLVYALDDELFAIRFDPQSLTVEGQPVAIASGVARSSNVWQSGVAQFDIADDGTFVFLRIPEPRNKVAVWVDRNGVEERLPVPAGQYRRPRLSPTGADVLFDQRGTDNTIVVWNFGNETLTRLTLGANGGDSPVWLGDGEHIAYHPGTGTFIDSQPRSNVGQPRRLYTGGSGALDPFHPETVSPSGTELLMTTRRTSATRNDIAIVSLDPVADFRWLISSPADETNARLSADEKWMAYQSDESGRFEIYVRPFPNIDANKLIVSNRGGTQPTWSPDSTELFYIEPGEPDRMIRVDMQASAGGIAVVQRSILLDWPYSSDYGTQYDVSEDGRRFIALKPLDDSDGPPRIVIVRGWFEELNRLVPGS
jgi:serine/threonine-protein kinase